VVKVRARQPRDDLRQGLTAERTGYQARGYVARAQADTRTVHKRRALAKGPEFLRDTIENAGLREPSVPARVF
jgi:hypothetical protein